jgi:hypothetical protein
MNRIIPTISLAAMSAVLALSTPAFAAGKHERAESAISEAKAKIEASAKVGATTNSPREQADAQAALRSAEELLASGHKEEAIAAAHHASTLADTALGQAQRAHAQNAQAVTAEAREQAAGAQAQAADAQAQAAASNARAQAAEQAAASAQADAANARATPVVVAAPAAPTTITTETTKTATPVHTTAVKHKVVRKAVVHHPAAVTEKTKTTVTTGQ